MRFRPVFLMPRFGCSKPAQLSERDELPPSRPVAPSPADLTGHEKSRNRFALGRRIPGWLQTRLEGKPKQAKKDTIDSGYASSSATDAKVPAASIPPDIPTFAQPFKEKVMELRQELSSEVERFLSAPDRKVLLSSSNPT